MEKALKRWRKAKAAFRKYPNQNTALELQVSRRGLQASVRQSLKIIEGGKRETGL